MILTALAIATCATAVTGPHGGQCHIAATTGQTVTTPSFKMTPVTRPNYTIVREDKQVRTAVADPTAADCVIAWKTTTEVAFKWKRTGFTIENIFDKQGATTNRLTADQDLWVPAETVPEYLAGGWKLA